MIMCDPCKEGKCISYPICISKDIIECPDLSKYIQGIDDSSNVKDHLNDILPNLSEIKNYKIYDEGKHRSLSINMRIIKKSLNND